MVLLLYRRQMLLQIRYYPLRQCCRAILLPFAVTHDYQMLPKINILYTQSQTFIQAQASSIKDLHNQQNFTR